MDQMMSGEMMWGMGLFGLLVIIVLVLGAAALVLLYLGAAIALHLLWETAQLPLYTIWWTGTRLEILFAVIHCTAGDLLITASALALAALIARIGRWPFFGNRMALTAILLGLGYTVFSEWLNTQVRQSWAYTEAMPLLPPLGTGLTPFLQWLIVPGIALRLREAKGEASLT
jgi:hypothetical protein